MTTFTRTWDATYESLPEDDDDALEGAARIRHIRTDVRERMEIDHSWAGDAHDGKHNQVTLRVQAGNPTLDADDFALFTKAVGGKTELFFMDEDSHVGQITNAGALIAAPTGAVIPYGGSAAPTGWLLCDGSAVSRSTYSALFAVIGTAFGVGDGATTFNLPDCRGRVIAGVEATATRLTQAISGIDSETLGDAGGHQDTQAHDHGAVTGSGGVHNHSASSSGSFVGYDAGNGGGSDRVGAAYLIDLLANPSHGNVSVSVSTSVDNSAAHTHTVAEDGTGDSGNVQPTIIMNYIIKY